MKETKVVRAFPRVVALVAALLAGGVGLGAGSASHGGEAPSPRAERKHVREAKPPAAQEAPAPRPAGGHGGPDTSGVAPLDPQEVWEELMRGNGRFVAGKPQPRALVSLRHELSRGQHPRAIVLGCSDSRVSPELVFDQTLGELFVVRTAGNIADAVARGSIEYAVDHLHAQLLVVLGHEKCGAVAAAASGEKMPTLNLEAIVRKISPALLPLQASGDRLVSLGVEANVRQSARDVVELSPMLRLKLEAKRLGLVKAVYRLETGEVARLP